MPVIGRVFHRFDSSAIAWKGQICYAVLLSLLPWTRSLPWLAVGTFIFGLCRGTVDVSTNTQAIVTERAYGSAVMSSLQGFWSLGGVIGAGFSSLLLRQHASARQDLAAAAAAMIVTVLVSRPLPAGRRCTRGSSGGLVTDSPDPVGVGRRRFSFPLHRRLDWRLGHGLSTIDASRLGSYSGHGLWCFFAVDDDRLLCRGLPKHEIWTDEFTANFRSSGCRWLWIRPHWYNIRRSDDRLADCRLWHLQHDCPDIWGCGAQKSRRRWGGDRCRLQRRIPGVPGWTAGSRVSRRRCWLADRLDAGCCGRYRDLSFRRQSARRGLGFCPKSLLIDSKNLRG